MPTTRVLGGMKDFAGQQIGTLRVIDIASRLPKVRWATRCERCGASGTTTHESLLNGSARCKAGGCGVTARHEIEEAQTETLASFHRKQVHAREVAQRQKEEASAKEIRDEEARLSETTRKLHQIIRERVSGQRDDFAEKLDPETLGLQMSHEDADRYNREQAAIFIKHNPSFYACTANLAALSDYFDRNGLKIISASAIAAAVIRLGEYGLLQERPTAKPVVPIQRQVVAAQETPSVARTEGSREEYAVGIDPLTGHTRTFTQREVDRMSSDEYRRCFKIIKSDLLLPFRNW